MNKLTLVAALALAVAGMANAGTMCPEHFYQGKEPVLLNAKATSPNDAKLCYQVFAVYHSAKSLTPLWSAEHLTREHVLQAKGLERDNDFHEAQEIATKNRAWLRDYSRSGFDRGHMAPSGDAPTGESQRETFTLANMIPQAPKLNRGIWEGYESALRDMVKRRGELYIITGPLFEGASLSRIGGRTLVPSSVYKVVLDPYQQKAAAIVCRNDDSQTCEVMPVPSLEARAKITFFPSGSVAGGLEIPAPKFHFKGRH